MRVGRFWVGPPWCEPDADADVIVIEPGAAFGTGAHGSTQAAMSLLLEREPGGALLDIGCGSGVLSILAARLGWGPIQAVDLDPLAVAATRENARRNGVALEAWQADALAEPLPAVPFAVANLERRLLEPLLVRAGLPPACSSPACSATSRSTTQAGAPPTGPIATAGAPCCSRG